MRWSARAGRRPRSPTSSAAARPAGVVNRLMRELGPMADEAPAFPGAASAVGPLRAAAEKRGSGEFSPLWAGQSVTLGKEGESALALTRRLAEEAKERLAEFAG